MAIQKPSIPKGTRDFSPEEVSKRQYIFDTIRHQFQLFGYSPIETPSFENLSTLTGKYGEEGDRLIFKILNSGDYLASYRTLLSVYIDNVFKIVVDLIVNEIRTNQSNTVLEQLLEKVITEEFILGIIEKLKSDSFLKKNEIEVKSIYNNKLKDIIEEEIIGLRKSKVLKDNVLAKALKDCDDCEPLSKQPVKNFIDKIKFRAIGKWFLHLQENQLISHISEKALRYDLTVPFARYVVQHQNEITFPFKRYQMQPVWRADRPQKGRFREFYQCDADVVGSDSLLQEVELISLYDSVFSELNIPVEIHFNNRKILSGLAEVADISDKLIDFTVALDKLDKIGEDKVKEEMREKGIPQSSIDKLSPLLSMEGDFQIQLIALESILNQSEIGMKGIEELNFVFQKIQNLGLKSADLILNLTLARGLDYYTGAILEVKAKNVQLGSVGGGGRYDDLTGIFGLKGISGVGISFGLDRIYLVLEELNLFPESIENTLDVLFINFGEKEAEKAMKLAKSLRELDFRCEVYPDNAKLKKQMQYADKKSVKYVIIIGEEELNSGKVTVKNMISGEQDSIPDNELTKSFNF